MKSKTSKAKADALKIHTNTYNTVFERDNGECVLCQILGKHKGRIIAEQKVLPIILDCHHFIPRSKLGMGIEQNLLMLCTFHHKEYTFYKEKIRKYLKSKYRGWKEEDLVFKKEMVWKTKNL